MTGREPKRAAPPGHIQAVFPSGLATAQAPGVHGERAMVVPGLHPMVFQSVVAPLKVLYKIPCRPLEGCRQGLYKASTYVSTYLSIHLSMHVRKQNKISVCLSIYLSNLSIYLSIGLHVYLSSLQRLSV